MFADLPLKDQSSSPLLLGGEFKFKRSSPLSSTTRRLWNQYYHRRFIHSTGTSIRYGLMGSVTITVIIILIVTSYLFYGPSSPTLARTPPRVDFRCHSFPTAKHRFYHHLRGFHRVHDHNSFNSQSNLSSKVFPEIHLDSKVLLFVESRYSHFGRLLIECLEAIRIKFKLEILGKNLPMLTNSDKGRFAVIIFENLEKYLYMHKWNRDLLDKYCREYNVGIIGFFPSNNMNSHDSKRSEESYTLKGFPVEVIQGVQISNYHIRMESPILRIAKAGYLHHGPLTSRNFTVFRTNDSNYEYLTQAFIYDPELVNQNDSSPPSSPEVVSTIVQDRGTIDGIQRVLFSTGFDFWVHQMLFLDALSYLSHGKFSRPLRGYILIDIDDIFVGEPGIRLKPPDVKALIETQERLGVMIPGFRFNLGFSGKYYHRGNRDEDLGDDALIENANNFWWFCHMWGHSQPHLTDNLTILEAQFQANKDFAVLNKLPLSTGYSIAPHHSGVYPVHEPLYEAWKKVWDIKVTSTEEYPHLRPDRLRRGFIHRGIMVLPRRTCGLYTHTIFIDKYPDGRKRLDNSIFGGDLFYSFVFNQFNVFMTHMSNYGNDRLAAYTFESVISFLKCWTNIQLETIPPLELATKYFQTYPGEVDPVWMNPCKDKRHLSIWSTNKSCKRLPDFLIIGPQKTGTTALYSFLLMHPSIQSSYPSPKTFEEVQFFNGKNYNEGLDWYMNFFPEFKDNSTKVHLFDKSATYFDGELVPMRAYSLLPDAKIVTILINPIKRAYSWYQHVSAHQDPVALNHSFYEVISANEESPKSLRDLRNRCLNPGCYANLLEKWINFYSPRNLTIIDGEELKVDPVAVLNRLQKFLGIEPILDYGDYLRFDSQKGFFCMVGPKNETKCLGRGKGRTYPPIDQESENYLHKFYLPYNVALSKLLNRINHPLPQWLEEELSAI